MGRPSIAEQRRIEIGRALQACVINTGSYRLTTVKDIAQQANVAPGLIHHYFESKDEILMMMEDLCLIDLGNALEELLRARTPAERQARLDDLFGNHDNLIFFFSLYFLSISMPELKKSIEDWKEELRLSTALLLKKDPRFVDTADLAADRFVCALLCALLQSSAIVDKQARVIFEEALTAYFPL